VPVFKKNPPGSVPLQQKEGWVGYNTVRRGGGWCPSFEGKCAHHHSIFAANYKANISVTAVQAVQLIQVTRRPAD